MQIALAVAMLIVGIAVLYVAATVSIRTRKTTAPLVDRAVKEMSVEIQAVADELRGQLQTIAAELRRDREQARLEDRKIQGRLDHADRQIANMSERILTEFAALRRLGEQVGARQDQVPGVPGVPGVPAGPSARPVDWAAAPVLPPARAVPEPQPGPTDTDPDWPTNPVARRPGSW
jgi:hypothetical protein